MAAEPKQSKDKKVLRYPQSIIAEETDYLAITVVAYTPAGRTEGPNEAAGKLISKAGARRNSKEARIKTIILPIPSNISDTNAAKFGDSELNTIGASLLGGVTGIMESGQKFTGGHSHGSQNHNYSSHRRTRATAATTRPATDLYVHTSVCKRIDRGNTHRPDHTHNHTHTRHMVCIPWHSEIQQRSNVCVHIPCLYIQLKYLHACV